MNEQLPLRLAPESLYEGLVAEDTPAPIDGATWHTAKTPGGGVLYTFPSGALVRAQYLWADFLLDGNEMVVWVLSLREGEAGREFKLMFSGLNQCSFRVRVPLEATSQNRWQYPREAAYLKPMAGGDVVDPARVDRMMITCVRFGERPARWCMTPFTATADEPPRLAEPLLPKGPLLDELGQSTIRSWRTKTKDADEMTARLRAQRAAADEQSWPEGWSRWGGDASRRFDATGFFRTHHDGNRWWLVDPEGCAFWSAGMDCVAPNVTSAIEGLESAMSWLPEPDGDYADAFGPPRAAARRPGLSFNYDIANFIRVFGRDDWHDAWATIALAELKRMGINTVANWSEWQVASRAQFPYVRPLSFSPKRVKHVFRDFPDVFDPAFADDAADYAQQLVETRDDRALIGYFLMNEPTWGFASMTPAEGMLLNAPAGCPARRELAAYLRRHHRDAVWGGDLSRIEAGPWRGQITEVMRGDLEAFSVIMAERLWTDLSAACRRVDPHHLNLGARYYTIPPAWALAGMQHFDVFSMNAYRERAPRDAIEKVSSALRRPVMVGEWHFGALDVGLPATGIGRVTDQADRGRAYRVYLEDAASQPACIGVHYFTLYDQSAVGRFDGECYNIGLLDVCHRPYEQMIAAARAAHERMYAVAAGESAAFDEAPPYLPRLFL